MAYSDEVLFDGPVGYWRLNEASGTLADDIGSANNDGTYVNAPTRGVAGALGPGTTAVAFSRASSQYVSIPDAAAYDIGDVFTIEVWVNRGSVANPSTAVFSLGAGAPYVTIDQNGFVNCLKSQTAGVTISTIKVDDGEWHHVVWTKSGITNKLYIDGVDRTGSVTNATMANCTVGGAIGAERPAAGTFTEHMEGAIDEVSLYNFALSSPRILIHYGAARSSVGRSVALPATVRAAVGRSVALPALLVGSIGTAGSSLVLPARLITPFSQTRVARISLGPASIPPVRTAHYLHVRARVTGGSGTIRAALYEGSTNRSGDLETTALTGTLADYTLPISDAAVAAINDYSNLEIRVWGYSALGGVSIFEVDSVSLEKPAGLGFVGASLLMSSAIVGSAVTAGRSLVLPATIASSGVVGRTLSFPSTVIANIDAGPAATTPRVVLQPNQIAIRHIKAIAIQLPYGPPAVDDPHATLVGNVWYKPSRVGLNGARGWVSGSYEDRLNEEGSFSLVFPNSAGEDGVLHRDRFDVVRKGKLNWAAGVTSNSVPGGDYRPGDEWIEIYRVGQGSAAGDLLFVGTPTSATVTRDSIEIKGFNALWWAKKWRETAAGFWNHSPVDAITQYTRSWRSVIAEDFSASSFSQSSSEQTSGPWRWENASTGTDWPSVLRVLSVPPFGYIKSNAADGFPFTLGSSDPYMPWRLETSIRCNQNGRENGQIQLSLGSSVNLEVSTTGDQPSIQLSGVRIQNYGPLPSILVGPATDKREFTLAIEGRERWIYYYFDGDLIGVLPMPLTPFSTGGSFPTEAGLFVSWSVAPFQTTWDVDYLLLRVGQKTIQQSMTGDRRLPGIPPGGGLTGTYYQAMPIPSDPVAKHLVHSGGSVASDADRYQFIPTREPYARRLDPVVNFNPISTYTPTGMNAEWSAIRWTGAIYLDLASNDRFLRLVGVDDYARMWIGKTLYNDLVEVHGGGNGTSGSMRAALGSVSGWYPIVIEYFNETSTGSISLQWATSVGAFYSVVPSSALSPLGVYENQVRYESHYDLITEISKTFGYQLRMIPRSLESGAFPGEIAPYVRVGRDTAYVLESSEATDIGLEISSEEVADTLVADAAGLADPTNASQITVERFDTIAMGQHGAISSEYEALSDISVPELAKIRLDSMLALRGSPWEQVSARPPRFREMVDSFPLTGTLSEFDWQPGDSIRLMLPEVGVVDASPRQILGVTWPVVPNGRGNPAVSFRQRPRSLGEMLRRLRRETLTTARNFQGQLVVVSGTQGGTVALATDEYARAMMPSNPANVAQATLIVHYKTDTSAWNVRVNDQTDVAFVVTRTGRYDLTAWVRKIGTEPKMYVRLTSGTGQVAYGIELLVVV